MLATTPQYSLSIMRSQHVIVDNTETSPPPVNFINEIRNVERSCVTIPHGYRYHDFIGHGQGKKLESIKTSFHNIIKSLRKYNISINTMLYTQLGPSGRKEIAKAMEAKYISFESGAWVNKKDDSKVLLFYLPKEKMNYRVELAHRNNLNMNTDSTYEFQMRIGYAARSAIFFQVKESGGNMLTSGGGRPPVSLNIKNEKEINIAMNSEEGRVLKERIAILDCPQEWYDFKIRIIWNREHPSVQVNINGKAVFQSNEPFGAYNSKSHYSKFGIYIPQQKNEDGIKSTSFLFDNVKENHRQFICPTSKYKNR